MNSFTPFVLGLLVLVGCCSAYIKDCNERLDVIGEGAWPALGGFSSEVLNRAEVLAIGPLWDEASRPAIHTVVHTTENRTYIRGNHSTFHLYGGVVTRELYELRGVPVKDIQMGGSLIAILTKDGRVWTAGSNRNNGRLGHHSESVYYPVFNPVEGLPPVGQIAVANRHTVVMTRNGTLMSWGYNGDARLGYDTPTNENPTPRKISVGQGTTAPRYICSGLTYSLAFMEDSTVITWGLEGYLGHPKTGNQPGSVHGLPDNDKVIQVSCGDYHAVALTEAGKLYAWGRNYNGQLLQADRRSPTATQLDLDGKIARDVVAGDDMTIVRTYSKDAEFFGKVNGVIHRTMQVANGTDYPRDLMARSDNGQRTWGAVRLGCVTRNPCGN